MLLDNAQFARKFVYRVFISCLATIICFRLILLCWWPGVGPGAVSKWVSV